MGFKLLDTLVLGDLQTNCYILGNEKNEGIIIDPAEDKPIINKINELGLKPIYILLTHGHYDHIGGVINLCNYFNCKVACSKLEIDMLGNPEINYSIIAGEPIVIKPDILLSDGDKIGDLIVLNTPGHTPGSICYIGDGFILSGDTLFLESIGRTDLWGGDDDNIIKSINKILKYPDDTIIYPGHGPHTTVGHEKIHNPYI